MPDSYPRDEATNIASGGSVKLAVAICCRPPCPTAWNEAAVCASHVRESPISMAMGHVGRSAGRWDRETLSPSCITFSSTQVNMILGVGDVRLSTERVNKHTQCVHSRVCTAVCVCDPHETETCTSWIKLLQTLWANAPETL